MRGEIEGLDFRGNQGLWTFFGHLMVLDCYLERLCQIIYTPTCHVSAFLPPFSFLFFLSPLFITLKLERILQFWMWNSNGNSNDLIVVSCTNFSKSVEWISSTWRKILKTIAEHPFRKCGILKVLSGNRGWPCVGKQTNQPTPREHQCLWVEKWSKRGKTRTWTGLRKMWTHLFNLRCLFFIHKRVIYDKICVHKS